MFGQVIVTQINDCLVVRHSDGTRHDIRSRRSYGLAFSCGGTARYFQNDRVYRSDPTHALLLPQGQTYSLAVEHGGAFPLINFETAMPLTDHLTEICVSDAAPYLRDFARMREMSVFSEKRLYVLGVFYALLDRLEQAGRLRPAMQPVLKYLEHHYCDPTLNNAELARQAAVSESQLLRLFRADFHTTPKQYVRARRIEKAKGLLAEGTLKVEAVAAECGFSNPYHFCRTFKSMVGVSPTLFMQQNQRCRL